VNARIGVVTFPGSLDDKDAARAIRLAGGYPVALWHADSDLYGVDAVILPGGFSYGDYLRAGAIARFAAVMEPIVKAAADGLPVLGICNGFQVLCEAHLLPGALTRNRHLHFRNRDQALRMVSTESAWTGRFQPGQEVVIPVKNGEGCYVADERTLDELEAEGRHRGDPQRRRQRRRDHAPPRARRRGADRPVRRRARVLRLRAREPWSAHMTGPERSGGAGHRQAQPAGGSGLRRAERGVGMTDFYEGVDTVTHARETGDDEQPYAELGLRDDEYQRIRQILGRRPTRSELAMYSIMWSEHCSYKSSKVHLRQFGEKAPRSDRLLAGIGENAGVIRITDELAVTFKVESHNHPSFVEPHQGAATGVGGIVRDILAMGARPVAVMDPLRFGAADHEDTKRVLPGIVAGVGTYGNCLGLPNIGGEVVFDPCYQGNPLVNALCVGVLPVDRLQNN
jgi:phosphoribosylformylglycinamidine synthase I